MNSISGQRADVTAGTYVLSTATSVISRAYLESQTALCHSIHEL